ncbi:MAG: BTAD domain-containing putative transcriptional regulator [Stenotrophomonas sp.]
MPPQLIYRKGWALLGYLAAEPERRHSRLALAMLLWPQFGEPQAMTNLRQVLCNLNRYCRGELGPGVLCVERDGVALRRAGRAVFDIDRLAGEPAEVLAILEGQHIFLAGMDDVAGVDFRAWLESTHLALEAELVGVAERHCDRMLVAGSWGAALHMARLLLQRDAWNEAHARRMMRAYAGHGMRAAATNAYARIQQALRRDLGVDPQDETRRLLAWICEGLDLAPVDAGLPHAPGRQDLRWALAV